MKKSKRFTALCKKYGVDPDLVPEILSYQAACKELDLNPENKPGVSRLPKRHQKRIMADYELTIIAEALKKKAGVAVDYNDTNRPKYHPVFKVIADNKRPSGFGLSYYVYGGWFTHAAVGVRLCFPVRDIAVFFGKHFLKLHTDHHLLT